MIGTVSLLLTCELYRLHFLSKPHKQLHLQSKRAETLYLAVVLKHRYPSKVASSSKAIKLTLSRIEERSGFIKKLLRQMKAEAVRKVA